MLQSQTPQCPKLVLHTSAVIGQPLETQSCDLQMLSKVYVQLNVLTPPTICVLLKLEIRSFFKCNEFKFLFFIIMSLIINVGTKISS
jgi:hypothetical protein